MNKEILSAILLSTILGAAIGFGSSYIFFNDRIQTLRDSQSVMQSDLSAAKSQLSTIQSDMSTWQSDLSAVKSQLLTMESNLSALQLDLSAVKFQIPTIQSNLSALQSDLSGAKSQLSTIQSDMSTWQSDLEAIDAKMNQLTTRQWKVINVFSGSGSESTTTVTFTIEGDLWRYSWVATVASVPSTSAFAYFLYPKGESETYVSNGYTFDFSLLKSQGAVEYIVGKGDYYFTVRTVNLDSWIIGIESYE